MQLARTVVVGGGVRCALPFADGALVVREAALEAIGMGPTALWCEEAGGALRSAAVLRTNFVALLGETEHLTLLTLPGGLLHNRPRIVSRLRVFVKPPFREPHLLASCHTESLLAIASHSSVSYSWLKPDDCTLTPPQSVHLQPGTIVWHMSVSAATLAVLTTVTGAALPASTLLLMSHNSKFELGPARSVTVLWGSSAAPPMRVLALPGTATLVMHQNQVSIFGADDQLAARLELPLASLRDDSMQGVQQASSKAHQAEEEANEGDDGDEGDEGPLMFCSAALELPQQPQLQRGHSASTKSAQAVTDGSEPQVMHTDSPSNSTSDLLGSKQRKREQSLKQARAEVYIMATNGQAFVCRVHSSSDRATLGTDTITASLISVTPTSSLHHRRGAGGLLVPLRNRQWLVVKHNGDVLHLSESLEHHLGSLSLPWSPVLDCAAVESEAVLYVCTQRSLMLLRHGVALSRLGAPADLHATATSLWSAVLQRVYLLVSFAHSTRVLCVRSDGSLDDAGDTSGVDQRYPTLYACAVPFSNVPHFGSASQHSVSTPQSQSQAPSGAAPASSVSVMCQVHPTGVLFLRPGASPPVVAAWHPPGVSHIIAAAGGRHAIFVALSDRRILRLNGSLQETSQISLTENASAMSEALDGSLWVGLYTSVALQYSFLSGTARLSSTVNALPAVPHALQSLSTKRLVIGLRDGRVLLFDLSTTPSATLRLTRRLGTSQVSLVPLPDGSTLLLSDSTALIKPIPDSESADFTPPMHTLSLTSAISAAPLPLADAATALAVIKDQHLHVLQPDSDAPRTAHAQRLFTVTPHLSLRRLLPLPQVANVPARLLLASKSPKGVDLTLLDLTTYTPVISGVQLGSGGETISPTALAAHASLVCVGTGRASGQVWLLDANTLRTLHTLQLPGRVGALHLTGDRLVAASGHELRIFSYSNGLNEITRYAHPSSLPLQCFAMGAARMVLGTQRDGLSFVALDEMKNRCAMIMDFLSTL